MSDINSKLQKAIDKANNVFKENYCSFFAEISLSSNIVYINIEWGDWKHEHGYADYIMKCNGFSKINERIIEEDGSDCYSSIHYYTL